MRRWYEPKKDTPGIDKNAPKKKGFARYLETLWREFFPLLKLNLLFLVSCIPVVTSPAALTAMNRITVTMVRDRNYFMLSDYWDAFKRDFWRSLLAGVLFAAALAVFGLSTWFYYMLAQASNKFFLAFAGVSLGLLLTAYGGAVYFFPMLAMVELPTKKLLQNSLIMVYTCFKKSIPAIVISLVILLAGVGLLPFSLLFIVLIMFSLVSMTSNFFIVRSIETVVLGMKETPEGNLVENAEASNTAQLDSAQLGEFPEWEEEEGDN